MLVRITNRCQMGCRHCFIEESAPDGEHMSGATFDAVLRFHGKTKDPLMLISGGEPFEHPQVFSFIEKAQRLVQKVIVVSNGTFADDPKLYEEVRQREYVIQVTNDPTYYPRRVNTARLQALPKVFVEQELRSIVPCRRTQQNGVIATRQSPMCFNFRSAVRWIRDFYLARQFLLLKGYMCSPSVNIDGSLRLGEADMCWNFGDVWTSLPKLTENVISACCDRCGLFSQLPEGYQRAIVG